jgi:predicted Abi (CAAX) family protease
MAWRLNTKRKFRFGVFLLLVVVSAIAIFLLHPQKQQLIYTKESNYAIHARQSFNQPQYYPIEQTLPSYYQPIANWVGRLILPDVQQMRSGADWLWLEVQHAPPEAKNLIGKVVRLEWKHTQQIQSYVRRVTRDVNFTPATKDSERAGNIHPSRLDGRLRVGPLQSLAGFRPNDDVIVTLDSVDIVEQGDSQILLQIEQEPVLATGRFYGLVKILKAEIPTKAKVPKSSEFFRVRHYNPASSDFDGAEEIIRIPQQAIDTRNIPPSTPQQIEASTAGKAGWYIYGAKDASDVFVVQALAPRSLFQLQPDDIIWGTEAGINYIKYENWQKTEANKGKIRKALIVPQTTQPLSEWHEGDKAIVLHIFGGIGGKKGEALSIPSTVTGHFAFGVTEIVRDRFTNELQFAIHYHQIYAHNPDGIISGTHSWANYMGNLQWGWLATRPVTDILIKFDPVTQDYNFDGIKLSPLQEFIRQLQIMMARYRVGDGTGSAIVTPAISCVQDSNQALYAAIKAIRQQVHSTPAIQQWLKTHPEDSQTLRFQQLVSLGLSLEKELLPLGIVRADWESNATAVAGIDDGKQPFRDPSIWAGLTSWRSTTPRQAHDELAALFLKHGAKLWFLQSNQVGGWNPDIIPVAPTAFFGQIKIPFTQVSPMPIILNRVLASLAIPEVQDWLVVGVTLLMYGAIALPLGFSSGFLQLNFWSESWIKLFSVTLGGLIFPALSEELVFRVLLLPHPTEVVNWGNWALWAVFSLLLFILYHPLNGKIFSRFGLPTASNHPIFLTLAGLLGLGCTVAYALTGSLWAIATIHWIVVVVWLIFLGGMHRLYLK